MDARKFDQRLTIIRETTADDGYGGKTETETTFGQVKAHIEPVRGQERMIADRERGVQTYRVTSHNRSVWRDVGTGDVLRWNLYGGETVDMNVRAAPSAGRERYRTIEAETGVVT